MRTPQPTRTLADAPAAPAHTAATLPDTNAALRARFAEEPGALLERVAEEFGVSHLDAAGHLPAAHCRLVARAHLRAVLDDIAGWGEVMFLVHLPAFIVEVKAPLPPASPGRGFLNFHGDSPLGGHLREDAIHAMAFLDRPFMGRRSCAVLFFDAHGGCVFKIFVAREADRSLQPAQLARFEALRDALPPSAAGTAPGTGPDDAPPGGGDDAGH